MYERYCKLRDSLGYRDSDVAKGTGITNQLSPIGKRTQHSQGRKTKKIALFLMLPLTIYDMATKHHPTV